MNEKTELQKQIDAEILCNKFLSDVKLNYKYKKLINFCQKNEYELTFLRMSKTGFVIKCLKNRRITQMYKNIDNFLQINNLT